MPPRHRTLIIYDEGGHSAEFCEEAIDDRDLNTDTFAACLGYMLAIFVVLRGLSYVLLVVMHKSD